MTRFIQLFASDSQNFRKQLHDTVICQFNVAQNVADLYRSVFFRARFKGGKISKGIFNLIPSLKKARNQCPPFFLLTQYKWRTVVLFIFIEDETKLKILPEF